ncbi:hypothetical protein HDV00_004750, partial [Rhizophlyctis rosea]
MSTAKGPSEDYLRSIIDVHRMAAGSHVLPSELLEMSLHTISKLTTQVQRIQSLGVNPVQFTRRMYPLGFEGGDLQRSLGASIPPPSFISPATTSTSAQRPVTDRDPFRVRSRSEGRPYTSQLPSNTSSKALPSIPPVSAALPPSVSASPTSTPPPQHPANPSNPLTPSSTITDQPYPPSTDLPHDQIPTTTPRRSSYVPLPHPISWIDYLHQIRPDVKQCSSSHRRFAKDFLTAKQQLKKCKGQHRQWT